MENSMEKKFRTRMWMENSMEKKISNYMKRSTSGCQCGRYILPVAASVRSNDFVYNLVSAEHVAHNLSQWKATDALCVCLCGARGRASDKNTRTPSPLTNMCTKTNFTLFYVENYHNKSCDGTTRSMYDGDWCVCQPNTLPYDPHIVTRGYTNKRDPPVRRRRTAKRM